MKDFAETTKKKRPPAEIGEGGFTEGRARGRGRIGSPGRTKGFLTSLFLLTVVGRIRGGRIVVIVEASLGFLAAGRFRRARRIKTHFLGERVSRKVYSYTRITFK